MTGRGQPMTAVYRALAIGATILALATLAAILTA